MKSHITENAVCASTMYLIVVRPMSLCCKGIHLMGLEMGGCLNRLGSICSIKSLHIGQFTFIDTPYKELFFIKPSSNSQLKTFKGCLRAA